MTRFSTQRRGHELLYLVLNYAAEEWKQLPRERFEASTQFAVLFGERFVEPIMNRPRAQNS